MNISAIRAPFRRPSLLAAVLVMLGLALLAWPAANAEPAQTDPVQTYCVKITSDSNKAAAACRGTDNQNVNWARNAAAIKNCKGSDVDSGEGEECVIKYAKKYLLAARDDAVDDHGKNFTADNFHDALVAILKKTGVNYKDEDAARKAVGAKSTETTCIGECSDDAINCNSDRCDFIGKYVNPTINLLSIAFGLIAVISVIIGGIQYSASNGDSQKVTQAKQRISKTLFAIVAYFFLYAFLQFIVPGGIFK